MEKILHQLRTIGKYEALQLMGCNGTINQLAQDFATIHSIIFLLDKPMYL